MKEIYTVISCTIHIYLLPLGSLLGKVDRAWTSRQSWLFQTHLFPWHGVELGNVSQVPLISPIGFRWMKGEVCGSCECDWATWYTSTAKKVQSKATPTFIKSMQRYSVSNAFAVKLSISYLHFAKYVLDRPSQSFVVFSNQVHNAHEWQRQEGRINQNARAGSTYQGQIVSKVKLIVESYILGGGDTWGGIRGSIWWLVAPRELSRAAMPSLSSLKRGIFGLN
jgi:hypothetical protein